MHYTNKETTAFRTCWVLSIRLHIEPVPDYGVYRAAACLSYRKGWCREKRSIFRNSWGLLLLFDWAPLIFNPALLGELYMHAHHGCQLSEYFVLLHLLSREQYACSV